MSATLSTHILDLERGAPAAGVTAQLGAGGSHEPLGTGVTNTDGRISDWGSPVELAAGVYWLSFEIGDWLQGQQRDIFFPRVYIEFTINDSQPHYHVPLLLSPYGYSTYRGS